MPYEYELSAAEFATLAGVSRQIITRLANENKLCKIGTKLDIQDPVNILYLQERELKLGKEILSTFIPKKKPAEKEKPVVVKKDRPQKEKAPKPPLEPKPKKEKQTIQKPKKEKPESQIEIPEDIPDDPDPPEDKEKIEMRELGKKATIAKFRKEIMGAEKAEMELRKARAELAELQTLGETCIGYLIALNQEILDQPRSFIDEMISGIKTGKSKTDLTDILRKPAMVAIAEAQEILKKELLRYKRDVKNDR